MMGTTSNNNSLQFARSVNGTLNSNLGSTVSSRYVSHGRVRRIDSGTGSMSPKDDVSIEYDYIIDDPEAAQLEDSINNAEESDDVHYITVIGVDDQRAEHVSMYLTPVVAEGSQNMDPDGYYILVPTEEGSDTTKIHANMLKQDQYGYIVLPTNLNQLIAPPRPLEHSKQEHSQTGDGCKRFQLAAFLLMALISSGSVAVTILVLTGTWKMGQDVSEVSATQTPSPDPDVPVPLFCGERTTLNISEPGTISCIIMDVSSTSLGWSPSVSVLFTGTYLQKDVSYISSERLPVNRTLTSSISGYFGSIHHVTLSRGNGGRVEFNMTMSRVLCCDNGVVSVTVGHVTTTIKLEVAVAMPCEEMQLLKWNTASAISCSRCICTTTPAQTTWMYRPAVGGVYEAVNTSTWTRYAPALDVEEDRGVYKMELAISPVHCHDRGTYRVYTGVGGEEQLRGTIVVSVTGYSIDSPPAQILALLLNPRHISSSFCLSRHLTSTTYDVIVSVNTDVSNETLDFTKSTNITTSYKHNITLELSLVSGLLSALWQFEPVHCDHGGKYSIQADGETAANFSITVDESHFVKSLEMREMHDETGYVEQYNITMKCQGYVGCKQHPVTLISPEVQSDVTYTKVDVDGDGIDDVYRVLLHWTITNISMALNGTKSTCKLSLDAGEKIKTQNIDVIESTFCDGRRRPCEYAHPYHCNMWVSCQRDRPRVKYCTAGTYFIPHGKDECIDSSLYCGKLQKTQFCEYTTCQRVIFWRRDSAI